MENIQERKKCNRCNVNLLLKDFRLKRDGLYTKYCLHCLKGYTRRSKKLKEKNKDKFECKECDKKFSVNSKLKRHINSVHLKIKDNICEYENCDYKFSENFHLKEHIERVHLNIKNFKCKECDFTFYANGDLQQHIKQVHLKIKDFQCEYCDFKCSSKGNLNQHIKMVHDKIKDFQCEDCDYKCSGKNTLKKHINSVHLKIKNFKCENCEYICSTNGHLQRHIQICTGKEHISSGEYQVRECLQEMNIDFQHNTSYIVKDIQLLQWDFILYKDDEIKAFIEYDGKQHFMPIRFGGISTEQAKENLETSKKRDKIKDDFCKKNNYPLLRIPYTEFGNIPQMVTEFCVEHLDWGYE